MVPATHIYAGRPSETILAVNAEQKGRFVTYHLSDDRVGELIEIAETLLADVARGVYECTRYNVPVTEKRRKG